MFLCGSPQIHRTHSPLIHSLSLSPTLVTFIFLAQNLTEVHCTWKKLQVDKRENLSIYILLPSQSILFGRWCLYRTLKNEKKEEWKTCFLGLHIYTLKNYSADGISKHSRLSGLAKLLMHLLLLASGDWSGLLLDFFSLSLSLFSPFLWKRITMFSSPLPFLSLANSTEWQPLIRGAWKGPLSTWQSESSHQN